MQIITILLSFLLIVPYLYAEHEKHRGIQNRNYNQKQYNDYLMAKTTININDRIWYNKVITESFHELLCPYMQELIVFEQSNYYKTLGYKSLEDYHLYMLKNISDFYINEIYNQRNYPTYRENVTLENIIMKDVYIYYKYHCRKYKINNSIVNYYMKNHNNISHKNINYYNHKNTINSRNKKIPHAIHDEKKYYFSKYILIIIFTIFCLLNVYPTIYVRKYK